MDQPQSATSLENTPEQERKARLIKYSIAMGIRVVCLVVGVFLQGWLMWVAFAGAIFLPYFAVIVANAPSTSSSARKVTSPTQSISAGQFNIVND